MASKPKGKTWIDDLSAERLVCGDLKHAWKPHTAKRVKGGYERELICRICELVKVQDLDSAGYILRSRYRNYPPGYLRTGLGRITAAENALLRLTHIRGIV